MFTRALKTTFVMVIVATLLAGCREDPARFDFETPQQAVVGWLEAVDGGDVDAVVEMLPPGLEPDEVESFASDLGDRLEGASRDDDKSFALSESESEHAAARVRLRQDGELTSLELRLEAHDGRWFVLPVIEAEGAEP